MTISIEQVLADVLPLLSPSGAPAGSGPAGLAELAAAVHHSPWHAQRLLSGLLGETPARHQARLRLELAAALLVTSDLRIVDIAVSAGFSSHEAFSRAFARELGSTPSAYRRQSQVAPGDLRHRRAVEVTGPSIRLYRLPLHRPTRRDPMTYTINRRNIDKTPTLHQVRRLDNDEIATGLAEILPAVYGFVMSAGVAMAGVPYVRLLDRSPAFTTIEAGIPLAEPHPGSPETGIESGFLPGGEAAVTIHQGPYEQLGEAHAAIDRWLVANDLVAAGPPWESYLTDPGETPDPADWKTEVLWPIAPTES